MVTLTPREHDVMRAIKTFRDCWGEPPTRRELGHALGISRPTVELHLQRMAGKGALTLVKRWRGIQVREQT